MDKISFGSKSYPAFQGKGFGAQYAIPFAKHLCIGKGYDVGCGKPEWALPGAIPIDPKINPQYDALNFPETPVDYIFSSHCLEHIPGWVDALDYWTKSLRTGGALFLYLPDFSQLYWRPWHDRRHLHVITPEIITGYMQEHYTEIMCSGVDFLSSFMVYGEKK